MHLPAILDDEGGAVIVEVVRKVAAELFDIQLTEPSSPRQRPRPLSGRRQVLQRSVLMLSLGRQIKGALEGSFKASGSKRASGFLVLAFLECVGEDVAARAQGPSPAPTLCFCDLAETRHRRPRRSL